MPFPTLPRQAPPAFPSYKSPYGPKYFYQSQIAGITSKSVIKHGLNAGFFGGVALFAVIFFASGIPRLQQDVLMKIPFLEQRYVKNIPASDNPF